jgi:hypothetical protein
MRIGSEVEDGILVRNKDCEALECALKGLLDRVRRLKGKRLVVSEGRLITGYRAEGRRARRLVRQAMQRNMDRG